MKRIVLIDGDIELFRTAQASELEVDWGDDLITMSTDLEHSKNVIDLAIDGIVKKTGADDYIFCISGSDNFRKKHHPTYKSNRVSRKPMGYKKLVEFVVENYKTKIYDVLEADDVMGILASMPTKGKEYVIYSDDKDMYTIPALIWDKKSSKVDKVSKIAADRHLYTQILTGDVVDGYKGCPSIGAVKAKKALATCQSAEEMLKACLKLYEKAYKDEAVAKQMLLDQAQQARILRHTDWDTKNKSVKLWNPFEGA